jgi:tetratricopeptide (TPR) repeat protein
MRRLRWLSSYTALLPFISPLALFATAMCGEHDQTDQGDLKRGRPNETSQLAEPFSPKISMKEALCLKKIAEYWQEGNIADARSQLEIYVKTYPTSSYAEEAYAMLGDLYFQEQKWDLALLHYQRIEAPEYQNLTALHRAEALYQLGQYDTLIELVDRNPELFSSEARIHLLLADVYYKQFLEAKDPEMKQALAKKTLTEFQQIENPDNLWSSIGAYLHSAYGEKQDAATLYLTLLEQETNPSTRLQLHLRLFNIYTAQNQSDAAAEHLLEVYRSGGWDIKSENLLWLGERLHLQGNRPLAAELYQKGLSKGITELEPLDYEQGMLKYQQFHAESGQLEQARTILTQLIQHQKHHHQIPWKHHQRVQYELAQLEESMGDVESALKTYREMIGDDPFSNPSNYLMQAVLKEAKLQLALLPPEEKYEGSPQLLTILGALKDLQIAKRVSSEPLHIEAALDYATLRCSLLPLKEQASRMIFYLQRIQEDFLSDRSTIGARYQEDRRASPAQDRLISQYLQYISTETTRLQSDEAETNQDTPLATELRARAKREFEMLAREVPASSPLHNRLAHAVACLE